MFFFTVKSGKDNIVSVCQCIAAFNFNGETERRPRIEVSRFVKARGGVFGV